MSDVKIRIDSLYKIFGENPKKALKLVQNGVGKDELLAEYKHVIGFADINMDIYDKSIQVIMGLSGSGKSTVIRHINRLIEPTYGKVFVDDLDVTALSDADLREFRRKKTAMVFQSFALLPHMTVIKNVTLGLDIQGVPEGERMEKAHYWIKKVGLEGTEDHYPQQLSGGMQQRVGLARALTNNTDIILMDEAFSALDPLILKDMQDILLDLQSELHKTVVFITHDLDEALKLGDRIAILKDGLMDQEGEPVDILMNPATPYVKRFVEDVNRARVLTAKHAMRPLNGEDVTNALIVNENQTIEQFIDKVVEDKPPTIVVQDKDKNNIGCITSRRLGEILKKTVED